MPLTSITTFRARKPIARAERPMARKASGASGFLPRARSPRKPGRWFAGRLCARSCRRKTRCGFQGGEQGHAALARRGCEALRSWFARPALAGRLSPAIFIAGSLSVARLGVAKIARQRAAARRTLVMSVLSIRFERSCRPPVRAGKPGEPEAGPQRSLPPQSRPGSLADPVWEGR